MGNSSRKHVTRTPDFITCGPSRTGRRSLRAALTVSLILLATPAPAADSGDAGGSEHPSWEKSGDILQWGIPLIGLGMSFLFDGTDGSSSYDFASLSSVPTAAGLNWPGPRLGASPPRDFLVSFLRMEVATYGLKYGIDAKRPNGGGQSFPSGHTAAAFMGAEFIRKHYGQWWGAPAFAAAGWVGYTRVQSHNHYWRDVIAGAVVGIASNYDFDTLDTPLGELSFGPAAFAALSDAQVGDDADHLDAPAAALPSVPGLRFEIRF